MLIYVHFICVLYWLIKPRWHLLIKCTDKLLWTCNCNLIRHWFNVHSTSNGCLTCHLGWYWRLNSTCFIFRISHCFDLDQTSANCLNISKLSICSVFIHFLFYYLKELMMLKILYQKWVFLCYHINVLFNYQFLPFSFSFFQRNFKNFNTVKKWRKYLSLKLS